MNKSIEIDAAREKVFEVLTADEYTRIWYAEFSEWAYAETDWKERSKAVFKDASGSGIIGIITKNIPDEALVIEYRGIVKDGREDYESDEAKAVVGGRESYMLEENGEKTVLRVEGDMSADFFETMSEVWDRALGKIKDLSEKAV